MKKQKVAVSWSGGKDGCFACYKALQEGFEVCNLLTMMKDEFTSGFHLIRSDILDAQSAAIGIPLIKKLATLEGYDEEFKSALKQLKQSGIETLVTGDIYEVSGHEEGWLNRICSEVGLKTWKPLWMGDTKEIFRDYLNSGFKAIVVRTKLDLLKARWLGRQLDKEFFDDIVALGNIDPCGENGEYHTLVIDGPIFNQSIKILETKKHKLESGYGFLEIKQFKITPKTQKEPNANSSKIQ